MTRARIKVLPSHGALMQSAAEAFVVSAAKAINAYGRFHVVLSGGATPKGVYELLATERYAARVDWRRVQLFWGDERCVPLNDPSSNYRMVRNALIDRIELPAANVHRIHGEDDPAEAAAAYEQELRRMTDTPSLAHVPAVPFDLVLLGLGDDGHTASLFPGLTAVSERHRWVMAEQVAALSTWRITCTPVVFNAAAEVIFLVAGGDKAAVVHRVLEGAYQPQQLPAQMVKPSAGSVCWLLDAAAATQVSAAARQGLT